MSFRDEDDDRRFSIRRILKAPKRWLGRFSREDQIGGDKPLGIVLWEFCTFPFRALLGFLVFMIVSWSSTRLGRQFVFGLPALVIAAGFFGAIWVDQYLGEERAVSYSRNRSASHLKNDNDRPWLAETFADQAVDLNPEDYDQVRFDLAQAYYAGRKTELAVDLVEILAPRDSDGVSGEFVDGHIWLADFYQSAANTGLTEAARKDLAKKHYRKVDESVLAKVGLANILTQEGDLASATASLESVNQSSFDYQNPRSIYAQISSYPKLIELYNRQEQNEKAKQVCRNAVGTMTQMVIDYPDYLPLWISISHCCVLTEDFDRAISVLIDGERRAQELETKLRIRQLAAEVLVVKAKSVTGLENRNQLRYRLIALSKAIQTDVRNVEAYREMANFIDKSKLSKEQALWVNELVLERGIQGIMHVVLGMQQIVDGKMDAGKNHWEIARKQYPFAPNVIYNLIEVAVAGNDELKPRKLELVEVAMALFPNQPVLNLTRGTFLMQDENYQAAIKDFELALSNESFQSVVANRRRAVECLIQCYKALGDEENLAVYEQRLNTMNEIAAGKQRRLEKELTSSSGEDSD